MDKQARDKIETIGRWSSHAALHSALESIAPTEKVLILIEYKDKTTGMRSANLTQAEALYLMEKKKFDIFLQQREGE